VKSPLDIRGWFGDPTNDPKTPQNAPKCPKTPNFYYILYNFREMKKSISPKTPQNAPKCPKTPNFDYDLYNFREMKKSIFAKTYESGLERPNTRKAQFQKGPCVWDSWIWVLGREYLYSIAKNAYKHFKLVYSLLH